MTAKKAFITGSTGFVGFYIAKSLVENGLQVRALVRRVSKRSSIDRLKSIGVDLVSGDILEPESYSNALDGVSYVFHGAAIHKTWTDDVNLLYRVNVDATKMLLEAAIKKKVEQFIYTSSIKTIGLTKNGRASTEDIMYNLWDWDTDYGKSKYLAERMLLDSREDITIKILNPAAVIGPGDKTLTPNMDLIYRFLHGKIKVSLDTYMGLVDVRDVGYAHFLALTKARSMERYILCSANLTMDDFFSRLSKLTNIKAPRLKIPYWVAYPIAHLSLGISAVTKRPPVVHPRSLNVARRKPTYSGSRAREELGIRYRDLDVTLRDAVDWLKGNPPG